MKGNNDKNRFPRFEKFDDPFAIGLLNRARERARIKGMSSSRLTEGFYVQIDELGVDPNRIREDTFFIFDNKKGLQIAHAYYHSPQTFYFWVVDHPSDLVQQRAEYLKSNRDMGAITGWEVEAHGKFRSIPSSKKQNRCEPREFKYTHGRGKLDS